jgi:sulfide dehydrogenase cytochrome subunit
MKLNRIASLLAITVSFGFAGTASAAPPDAVTLMASTCVGCHGADGTSRGPATPTIAGMAVDTFVEAMKSFKDGSRTATIMDRIAKGFTDEETKQLAEYYGKLPFGRAAQKTDAAMVSKGKQLHNEFCKKCHVDNGKKDEDGSNVLAGQWLPYLAMSIEDFTLHGRKTEKKMKAALEEVAKKDPGGLESLMQFYASQK